MGSTRGTSQCEPRLQTNLRKHRRLVTIGFAALLTAVLGLTGWLWFSSQRFRKLSEAIRQSRAYLHQNRPDLAFNLLSDVRDEEPGSGEAVAIASMALIRMGELRVARLGLERALRLNPAQFEATVTLAELNVDLGNGQRGADLFEVATRLRPREMRVWLALAKVLQDLSEPQRAIIAYRKVLDLDPDRREALIGLIRCSLLSYDPGQAEPWVTSAIQKYPDDPILLGLAARQAYERESIDEAIARADRAIARDPSNADALTARALARGGRSNWEQALPDAERAVASAPGDLDALQLLLMIETRLGLSERAAKTLRLRSQAQERIQRTERLMRAMEEHPEDPELRWRMGQVALERGSTLFARRCFEAALMLDPNFKAARESLAAMRASQSPSDSTPLHGMIPQQEQTRPNGSEPSPDGAH